MTFGNVDITFRSAYGSTAMPMFADTPALRPHPPTAVGAH